MHISQKTVVAVRFMLDVALHSEGGMRVSLNETAGRNQISEKYLWQVVSQLKQQGWVVSTRGAQGGYRLSEMVENLSFREILSTLEGGDSDNREKIDSYSNRECPAIDAVLNKTWSHLQQQVDAALDAIKFKDLVDEAFKAQDANKSMYVI